ncbi:carboxymuconolactone decarboxylase family protein [Mesorhizobium sp. M00.F.Ca.ET.216.01.1.1]|uniref:carboxymuconolactone decarboxylase family protein n=1 Tax=Mesorhizobium sp. M00.F.Ca.ET.216.01.1.1 TaxID=2500528 RepID=UPI000FD73B6D|nr:carboxymuconolactone decarboxylase family protein [Mesorhizobium sp. M00.F.Ca.ET.216.01.1.1]TGQ46952.1 carboxymuconolactone decarboxylase family protein [Mesorhizobium sp. M00.F.Ca.ET.216.01.1.1]
MTSESHEDRFSRGLEILRRIGGLNFDEPINALAETSADLSRFTVEYPYGDVLSRPGLDLPLRQLCTVSMLLADGSAQPQLKFHIAGFLNAGGEPNAIVELLFVSVAILGFPATVNAVGIVRSVFAERELAFQPIEPVTGDGAGRGATGQDMLHRLAGGDGQDYFDRLAAAAPDLAQLSIDFAFGEALARDGLEHKAKLLAIVAMLASSGNRSDALRLHLAGALANGVTCEEIIELLIQLSVYRGFPAALNAFSVARSVFALGVQPLQVDIPTPVDTESRTDRLERGKALLAKSSAASGDAVVRSFDDIAPDLGRMIVEHSYGEIFSRKGIDQKTRELSACAALAAIGSATTQTPLRVHINAALNVGASREEIIETLVNLAPYSGYPATQQAIRIAAEEFAKSNPSSRPRKEESE